ncbi:MAG: hypothetical protein AAGH64_03575 [Planctomycetota bacterium]
MSEEAIQSAPGTGRRTTDRSGIWRALRIEWLGQTAASMLWIASVFAYGISSAGDCLQLSAASAWLIANIATLLASRG